MKNIYLILLGVLLSACWREGTPLSFDRIVKITEVEPLNFYQKQFAGVVASAQSVDLAFAVSGLVDAMYVSEGENITKNQTLAKLDDSDYKLQVKSEQARYQTTESILERTKRLVEKNAASNQELEIAQADYAQARSNYNYALNRLSDTNLKAPFEGKIEKKYVDTYSEVSAGTLIYRLSKVDALEVKFTLPEADANMLLVPLEFLVVFDNLPKREFKAKISNYIDGSITSAGIPITLAITDKNFDALRLNIKIGFSCKVIVKLIDNQQFNNYTTVPISALINSENIWVYHKQTGAVKLREITTEALTAGDRVIISKGLKAGEWVVSAGVYSLREGEKVKVLK